MRVTFVKSGGPFRPRPRLATFQAAPGSAPPIPQPEVLHASASLALPRRHHCRRGRPHELQSYFQGPSDDRQQRADSQGR